MIGIDIVKIKRIENAIKKENFYNFILTDIEIEYAKKKSVEKTRFGFSPRAMTVAGLFAGKEAILKALGVGMNNGVGFKDVVIDHDDKGAPVVVLTEKVRRILEEKNKKKIYVSIAHDGDYATAIAKVE